MKVDKSRVNSTKMREREQRKRRIRTKEGWEIKRRALHGGQFIRGYSNIQSPKSDACRYSSLAPLQPFAHDWISLRLALTSIKYSDAGIIPGNPANPQNSKMEEQDQPIIIINY